MSYFSLFLISFAAATLLPFYSEVALLTMLYQGFSPTWIWVSATAGNTLGSMVNWGIGRYLLHYQDRRWFPVKHAALAKAQDRFQRYGTWTLLLAWLPVGGDALTFVAGVARVPLGLFTLLVGLGKAARYAVIIWLGEGFIFP